MVGVAYRIPDDCVAEEIRKMDIREQGGYSRYVTDLYLHRGGDGPRPEAVEKVQGLVYVAQIDNPHFTYLPMAACADVIARSAGPSGPNTEYLYNLHRYFEEHGIEDAYVRRLAEMVREREGGVART